jgi:glycosyltransferase involved in cell wall biosynthesis
MPYILQQYPDTKIRIAGSNIFASETIKQRLTRSTYVKYLEKLSKQFGLEDHVQFTGPLNAEQMKNEYLKCNVFVCPSSIENSPNSLAEAQILGVPCIASYVGGIPDMIPSNSCGSLYRSSDHIMLAYSVCNAFSSKWESTSQVMIATDRHNINMNIQNLLSIYHTIIINSEK